MSVTLVCRKPSAVWEMKCKYACWIIESRTGGRPLSTVSVCSADGLQEMTGVRPSRCSDLGKAILASSASLKSTSSLCPHYMYYMLAHRCPTSSLVRGERGQSCYHDAIFNASIKGVKVLEESRLSGCRPLGPLYWRSLPQPSTPGALRSCEGDFPRFQKGSLHNMRS